MACPQEGVSGPQKKALPTTPPGDTIPNSPAGLTFS